jgi:hypothetical protein
LILILSAVCDRNGSYIESVTAKLNNELPEAPESALTIVRRFFPGGKGAA